MLCFAVIGDHAHELLAAADPVQATATATDRTAMVYLLDELEQQGLVQRRPNPDDRRSYLIHLTGRGKQTQRKAAAELAKQADTLLKPLDAAERRQLVDLLTRIADHWDELNPGGVAKEHARPAQALKALQHLADAAEQEGPRPPARKRRPRPR